MKQEQPAIYTTSNHRLTEAQYAQLLPRLTNSRLSTENIELARRVMVDGTSPMVVAKDSGKTKQRIHGLVRQIWAMYEESTFEAPADWVRICVTLPADQAKKVQEMEALAISNLKSLEQ
jgi:TrfB plasmid transcriptional repressor